MKLLKSLLRSKSLPFGEVGGAFFLLLFTINMSAQAPASWTVSAASFQYQMTITSKANEACVNLADPNNYIAAFVGTQCRGVVKTNTSFNADKLGLLVVRSNISNGEKVSFQIYNSVTNAVINVLDSVIFTQGNTVGTLGNPFMMYTNHAPTDIAISTYTIAENALLASVIASLTAIDVDAGTAFTYSLTALQPENTQFAISGGNLTTNFNFDYETDSIKIVNLQVDDNGGCKYTETFTLQVANLNEAPTALTFTSPVIFDHQQAGSYMGQFKTTDPDLNDTHTYTLVAGAGDTDNAQFYVGNDSLYNVSAIDYILQSVYYIRARSTDAGGLFIENTFTINVSNVNDAPTDLALSNYLVDENLPTATFIGTLSVTDADLPADSHTLTLVAGVGGIDNSKVAIVGNTLQTTAAYNFEQKDSLFIRIQAKDLAGATYVETFTIVVNDINEIPTNIAITNTTVLEGLPINTTVGTFTTSDEDFNSSHTYSLVVGLGDTDNALFAINTKTLATAATYSFTNQTYSIRVRTTDAGSLFFEKIILIAIRDSNYVPTDIISSINNFNENIALATPVTTLTTIDIDATDTHTLSFVPVITNSDSTYFKIIGNTLVTDSLVNFEKKNIYKVRIKSTDPAGASVIKNFTLTVNDLNETPTAIAITNTTVLEGLPINTSVGTFTTTDEDFNSTFTYSLATGLGDADNALFAISNNTLVSNATYSFTNQVYSIRVRSTDNGGLFFEKIYAIAVRDSNYVPTDITSSINSFDENIALATPITTLTTVDYDSQDTHTLTLVSGAGSSDNTYFKVLNNTLITDSLINFEKKNVFFVRLKSTDPGNASVTKTFTLNANDINEAPNNISLSGDSIIELAPINTAIGTFTSADEDAGATHSYSLVTGTGDTDNALFALTGNQLVSNASYMFSGQFYSIRIRSTDNGGLTFEKVFSIKILNLNEAPSDIILDTTFVNEDNEALFHISKIRSVDFDNPDSFTYSLVSGAGDTDNTEFTIVNDNLIIKEKTNYDVKDAYSIRLKSKDIGGLSVEKAFVITVNDIIGNSIPLPSANYISPNGDGKNDTWKIDNVEIYKDFSLQIFDQFGQVIYDVPNNYNNEFDGKYKGNALPTGNYYYVFKNDKKIFKGNITVVN